MQAVSEAEHRALSQALPIAMLGDEPTAWPTTIAPAPRYKIESRPLSGKRYLPDGRELDYFLRDHCSPYGTTWFGVVGMVDAQGQIWRRSFDAVVDDFGALAEVERQP